MEDHCDKYNCGANPLNIKGNISIVHNQKFLNKYFSKDWCSSTSKYIYSGYAIAEKILEHETVIDVGCGNNPFKDHITNLIGIDPANENADIELSIEEYQPHSRFDVALCLGSINFGDESIIANQIQKVNNLLNQTARIYWRLNPGLHDHTDGNAQHISACDDVDFFHWTFEKLKEYANKYGFYQINCKIDTNGQHERLYAEWHREKLKPRRILSKISGDEIIAKRTDVDADGILKFDQETLNQHFETKGEVLNYNLDCGYKYTGLQLADAIADDQWVLDVGCGINPFKGKIKNLVGIDPVVMNFGQNCPDVITTIEDFKTDQKFDVAFCLGSIQFISFNHARKQFESLNALLNERATIHVRTLLPDSEKSQIFINWTEKLLQEEAQNIGFTQVFADVDPVDNNGVDRYYVKWVRE